LDEIDAMIEEEIIKRVALSHDEKIKMNNILNDIGK
jgi:hypothetical protein